MADMKQYRANWTIGGIGKKDVGPGEKVKLSDEDAAPLVACGALSPLDDSSASAQATADPKVQ